ncbi:Sterol-sensing domain and Acriflavin resistance protein family and Patched family-containing protein [Aphelenchoides besseyi]|nr:Sterol-sensing domain and Acriflavin resistance protein family and Patched family-containing protein [Aphelenchoides besseyi]
MFPALETDSSDTPFVRILKLGFQWLGKQIARRPWIWFGISTILTILFSSKIPFTPLSNDVSDFTPSAARARIELQRYKEFFANSGDPVNVYVFVTAKRDGNMLGIRELEEAVRLLNMVSDQVTLYDSIGNQNLTFSQFCKHFCTINEPIRHFYNGLLVNSNFGNATEHIDLGYPITTVLGRQLHMDPNFFGVKIEVKVGNESRVVAVNSLRTASGKSFLSLDNPQVRNNIREIKLIGLQFRAELPVNWPKTSIQKWELDVVNYVKNEFKSEYVDALVVSETFLTGEVVRAGLTLIPFLIIGFIIMCLFSIVTMSLSAFYMFQLGPEKILLAIMAPICPFMACGTALGLMFWMGFRFGSILCVTGFLVLAIGVDDAYLMVSAWQLLRKRQKKEGALCAKETRSQRLESLLVGVMMETGPSITVTTLTNALAFAIGISSSTPEIQLFSIGNALAITLDYVYQWTIYGAVMVIAGHWELKNEETTVDDVDKKQVVKPKTNIIGGLLRRVHVSFKTFFERCLSVYCKLLTNGFVASMVMILLAVYMYFSIYGILEIRAELRPEQLFLRNSDVSKVLDLRNKYIIPFYAVCIVFVNKPGNFSDPNNLQRLSNMVADFERLPSSLGKFSTKFFLRDYMEFVKTADETSKVAFDELLELEGSELELTKPRNFNSNELEVFLKWPEFSFWNGFVNLEENAENGDSWKLKKFFFTTASYGVDLTDWSRRAELLQQWRGVADSYPEYDISVFEDDAKFLDLIPTMIPQTAQSAICTLVCMFLVCLLFIRQPTAVIVANFSIFSTCIGVFGILSLMGVELDPITYSASIMSIGFSVDIPAHLVFHFYKTGGEGKTPMTTEHRLKHCLGSIGFPIFEAGISTIICVSSLNFVDLHMASVFARTMVLVVSIGLIHGILVIPIFFYLISLIPVWPRLSTTIPPDPSPPKQQSAQPILLEVNGK